MHSVKLTPTKVRMSGRNVLRNAFHGQVSGWKRLRTNLSVRRRPARGIRHEVMLLDAALPFDQEHRAKKAIEQNDTLKIGIVGFGNFGQFLAQRFIRNGHQVKFIFTYSIYPSRYKNWQVTGTSRRDYSTEASEMGAEFYEDPNDFAESHPDVVIFSTSIISLEPVLKNFPFHRLKRSTLIVDALSVKEFPKRLMLSILPPELDILCTHPMFGPDSGKGSWDDLPFMYECVRIGPSPNRQARVKKFVQLFEDEGCRMLEMKCQEHDKKAASTQFITHTVGRVLEAMDLEKTELDTKGFQSLLSLVDNTSNDSFDLYYGLFMYNQNATEEIDRLERAFELVKKDLFNRLHVVARERLFHDKLVSIESSEDKESSKIETTTLSKLNGKNP